MPMIQPDKLKALAKLKGGAPKMPLMGKVDAPKDAVKSVVKGSSDTKELAKHAPAIESAIEDKAEGKFNIKDKPTAQDVALAQEVYEALPSKAKTALMPMAGISLARAIVVADELADSGQIEDPEAMTAFLFLAGQLLPKEEPAAEV